VTAYYNENDRFAAAWLRELIQADLIVPGEVDERSITEVEPGDLKGFSQCHFFAGIGVWSYAVRAAGWPDDTPVWTGSCPCQSFSASGKREGFTDQRHLWPAWFRLIRELRPVHVFGEQVASKDGLAWFDVVSSDLEAQGYAVGAVDSCAAGYGAPYIRQRLYFVAFPVAPGRVELETSRLHGQGASGDDTVRCGGNGELADTKLRRSQQWNKGEWRVQESNQNGHSFWSDIRWHYCSDGKYRPVPAQPALFPLAARTAGRVGLLRGAGNSLCAPQAIEFVKAYLEEM
jgi:DNA (cytosine-5)-methyltransferase 1